MLKIFNSIPRIQTFDSLKAHRNYRFLWLANFCSNTAHWLQLLTLGWLVKFLSEDASNSALLVVGIGGAVALPGVFIGPLGGVLGDRLDRRKLVIAIDAFMALLALIFAVLVQMNIIEIWQVYLYALIAGSCESIKMPVRSALVANTVPDRDISNAFATSVLTIPGTRMIGPFVGGLIVSSFGFFWNFAIEAFLYTSTVLCLIPMSLEYAVTKGEDEKFNFKRMFPDVFDGFKYLWRRQKSLSYLIILSSVPNIICQPILFLLPLYTASVLNKGADFGGYLLAVNGAGGLLMVLFISAFGFPSKRGLFCVICAFTSASITLLLSQTVWIPVAFLVLAAFGATQTAFRTTNGVLVQTLTDDLYRVRVMSVYRVVAGMIVIFGLGVGWMTDLTSPRWTIGIMGLIGVLISALFLINFPVVRNQK